MDFTFLVAGDRQSLEMTTVAKKNKQVKSKIGGATVLFWIQWPGSLMLTFEKRLEVRIEHLRLKSEEF